MGNLEKLEQDGQKWYKVTYQESERVEVKRVEVDIENGLRTALASVFGLDEAKHLQDPAHVEQLLQRNVTTMAAVIYGTLKTAKHLS